jgi:hypothetical protein
VRVQREERPTQEQMYIKILEETLRKEIIAYKASPHRFLKEMALESSLRELNVIIRLTVSDTSISHTGETEPTRK